MRRLTLRRYRVLARIQAVEDRMAWQDAKWQRVASFLLELGGGFALGFGLGLVALVEALLRLAR
jgi:hypothetical protein